MKLIPEQFTKYGAQFNLVDRKDDWAVYRREKHGAVSHEVVRVKVSEKERVLPGGSTIEPGEYLPSSAEWGKSGFTLVNESDVGRFCERVSAGGVLMDKKGQYSGPDTKWLKSACSNKSQPTP